ncbi:MAG: response regulator [Gammaproteobacteria bacterium]|nr:MAG: response regulator [Gammaproteobacteria bacterium]
MANGKILYVEDNLANLALVEKILGLLDGMTMISARTAELGIEMAREHQPDIIILDINLPGISGIEALKLLRSYQETKDTPIIAMTASATKKDLEEGLTAGFDTYMTKPIDVADFIGLIKRIIGERDSEQRLTNS